MWPHRLSPCRLYHYSTTCLPMPPHAILLPHSSDDEVDPPWLISKMCRMIDDFSDVNDGEKEFMKMWNIHVQHYTYVLLYYRKGSSVRTAAAGFDSCTRGLNLSRAFSEGASFVRSTEIRYQNQAALKGVLKVLRRALMWMLSGIGRLPIRRRNCCVLPRRIYMKFDASVGDTAMFCLCDKEMQPNPCWRKLLNNRNLLFFVICPKVTFRVMAWDDIALV